MMAGSLTYIAARALKDRAAWRRVTSLQLGRELADGPVKERLQTLGLASGGGVSLPIRLELDSAVGKIWAVDYRQKNRSPDPQFRTVRRRKLLILERPEALGELIVQRPIEGWLERRVERMMRGHFLEAPPGWEWARLPATAGQRPAEGLSPQLGAALEALLRPGETLRISGESVLLMAVEPSMAELVTGAAARAGAVIRALESSEE